VGNIEDLKIILRAEVDKAISDLKRASREGKNAEKDWDGISKAFKKNIEHSLSLKNAFSQLSMQVAGGIAIYQLAGKTIQAIGKFASDSVKETTEAAEGHARLEAQLRATGYAAGFTVDELEGMASELQRVTKIEDDEVRSAQSTLLKFTSITGEEFKKATALSLDYAKATGGSASSAAQTLGQALEDPIAGFGKLRKAGVMLSDEEENLARQFVATGEEAKAKAVLLKALEDRVGGVAKAVGGADPAGMKTLRLAIKDVKEEAGQLIAVKIEPWVTALADEVERLRARLASKNENANAILQPIKFGNLIDTGDISGVREAIKNLSGKVSKEIVQAWIDEARKRNPLATSAQAAAIRAAEQELLNMSPLTVTGGGTSGGANNSDKKAAEHIKAVNDEINKNVLAIKLRASALGKEADTQEILNSYVSGYLKLIGDSNGLITEKNSTALALVGTINELKEAITAQQMLATKTAAWNALAQQSTTILEENRSTVDSLYKSIAQLSGADERKLQRDQALAKGNEALAAGNAELAESFFLIVDALDQLERKTVAQQVLATKTAAWNALAQQSTTILEENRSTVDSLYKSIDQLSGVDERKLQRDQALAKGNEAQAAGNAELAESFFLIVDALDQLERKTVAQQVLATKTAAWNTLAQQSTAILEANRSTVDSLYKSIDQLSGADERKLQRDQALAKGNEALAAGNAELAESFFLIVDALDQLERKTVAQQVLATKTAAWNTLAQQSTTILEENRSTVDSLYKSIDQLSGADERKLQRDQALAKGNEALAAGNAELAESFFLIVDALDQLERKTVAQQILATKTAAWNALAQQSMTILEENRSTVDSLYKSIDQLSGVDERKLQRDQALAKGNEALAAGNAELAESYFLIVDALDQIERKTVAQQVLATKTAAWNALAQQSTAILEENRSTVDSLYKSIDQLSGADERKLQRDQALAKGNEALAAGNAELAESYFLIVDALNVLIKKTNEFDSKKFFEELGDQALASAESVIASGLNDAFSSIGEAMASGESSADAFGAAMKNFFTSVLQQTSMLAINAGLRLLVEGGITMLPAAIGLLALGGVSAIAAGAISASGQVRQVDYDQYIIDPVIEAETDLAKMRINLIEDQLEKERELRDENLKKIEQQFDMEFSVLQDLWERGLISTQEYKNQAATLRSNEAAAREAVEAPVKAKEAMIEQIEDARKQKLSVLSIEGKKLQDELNGMSGWQKFWSGRDEQLKAQLNTIDARIKATNAAQSLPEISAAKYGADFITAGPRLLKVGDNPGGRERVRVEPIGTPNRFGPSQEQIIIQISGPVYGVEDLYLKLEKAGEQLLRGGRIKAGVFG